MKEAFEKIKERLEERRKLHADLSQSDSITEEEQIIQSRFCGCFCRAKEIVNQVAEEFLEKEFSEWCHDCKEYDKEKHHCPRWCKVIRTTLEEIKGNLDVPDINVGDIELLDSLHEKILKSKFAEEVTEAEIDALVKAKQSLNENKQSLNDGWIPVSQRLPEFDYDTVLAVTDTNFWAVMVYTKEHGFRSGDLDFNGEVIAWQPLPEPYKGE